MNNSSNNNRDSHPPLPSSPTPAGPAERRAFPRIVAELEVVYKSIDELVSAYSSDISEGGLYLPTNDFMPVGAVVITKINLPDSGPTIQAIARIAYVIDQHKASTLGRKPGMGIEFLDSDGKPVPEQIKDFIDRRIGKTSSNQPLNAQISACVLVVDDSEIHLEKTSRAVSKAGHRVITAKDGVEALSIAVRERPDLILSDVQMPNMNGWHLLRLIRARPSLASIPVIFLTTLNNDQERLKGYKLGVDDYLSKPFTEAELVVRMQRILERCRLQQGASRNKALRGDLSHVSLSSLLSLVEMEQRTGHLLLIHDNEIANLLIRNGAVVHIDLPDNHQEKSVLEQFFHILSWKYGQFELSAAEVVEEDTVGLPTSYVILEHAKRTDEGKLS